MLEVQKAKCNQCLFSENKVVSDARRKDIIETCLESGKYFSCHKDKLHDYSKTGDELCCKGWYDTFGDNSQMIQIARRLKMVKDVEVHLDE